jgi:hypothetical protein
MCDLDDIRSTQVRPLPLCRGWRVFYNKKINICNCVFFSSCDRIQGRHSQEMERKIRGTEEKRIGEIFQFQLKYDFALNLQWPAFISITPL